jgi:hypothetical protein
MKTIAKFGAAALAATTMAFAADAAMAQNATYYESQIYTPAPVAQWDGLYVGGSIGFFDGEFGVGKQVGFNIQSGDVVYGIEGSWSYFPTGSDYLIQGQGRLGLVVYDEFLAYVAGGFGSYGGTGVVTAGAGTEFKFSDNVSFFEQVNGVWSGGSFEGLQVMGGLRWYVD